MLAWDLNPGLVLTKLFMSSLFLNLFETLALKIRPRQFSTVKNDEFSSTQAIFSTRELLLTAIFWIHLGRFRFTARFGQSVVFKALD